MSLTLPGLILIPVIIASLFIRGNKRITLFVILCALSTVSIMHVGGSDIMAYHLMLVVCLVGCVLSKKGKISFSKPNLLWVFVLYCGFSILITPLIGDVYIIDIEGHYNLANSSLQQITQYFYLFFGFLTYIFVTQTLRDKSVTLERLDKVIEIAYLIVLIIGILQMILPVEVINTLFRNAVNATYKAQGARVSSTFLEPSVFSLFSAPLFISSLMKLYSKFRWKNFICIVLNIVIVLNNQSSSFYLGVIVGLIGGICMYIRDMAINHNVSTNKFMLNMVLAGGVFF